MCALHFHDGNVRMFLLLAHVKLNGCALPSLQQSNDFFSACVCLCFSLVLASPPAEVVENFVPDTYNLL